MEREWVAKVKKSYQIIRLVQEQRGGARGSEGSEGGEDKEDSSPGEELRA